MPNKSKKNIAVNRNLPEWAPSNAGNEFTTNVMPGVVKISHESKNSIDSQKKTKSKQSLTIQDYIDGVIKDNRTVLAQAITLIESNSPEHIKKAQEILKEIIPKSGNSIRLGITGAPGSGKSTFIESLGTILCNVGHKVAVLAIDPSSSRSHGSILGDKTRMETLSRHKNAFIRPSPSGGTLGGVARKTRETILICEAAGFDIILIETIGVGQSEITVRSMVDFFLLLLLPGAGDELQGIKKGAVELADAIVINKAEADNIARVNATKEAYQIALHYILPATEGWATEVFTASALNNIGIENILNYIKKFAIETKRTGIFEKRRCGQLLEWVYSMVEENIKQRFYSNPEIMKIIPDINKNVLGGRITPTNAVGELLNAYKLM